MVINHKNNFNLVVSNIESRDNILRKIDGMQVTVSDASSDSQIGSGAAIYCYNASLASWDLISPESEFAVFSETLTITGDSTVLSKLPLDEKILSLFLINEDFSQTSLNVNEVVVNNKTVTNLLPFLGKNLVFQYIPTNETENLNKFFETKADSSEMFTKTEINTKIEEIKLEFFGKGGGGNSSKNFFLETNSLLSLTPLNNVETRVSANCISTINSGVTLINEFKSEKLNRIILDAGKWAFNIFCSVSSTSGTTNLETKLSKYSEVNIPFVMTGTGSKRTVTLQTNDEIFTNNDANIMDYLNASLYFNNLTSFNVKEFVNPQTVIIYVANEFVNFNGNLIGFSKKLSNKESIKLASTTTKLNVDDLFLQSFQIDVTDSLLVSFYGKTTSSSYRTVYITFGGLTSCSFIETPIVLLHRDLNGINEDDHLMYLTENRGKLIFYTKEEVDNLLNGIISYINTRLEG